LRAFKQKKYSEIAQLNFVGAKLDVFQNPVGFGTRPAVSLAKALRNVHF
jgi:hypothetical protein